MRCKRGTRRNKKTGECEDKFLIVRRERCANGTRRYPAKSKKCLSIEKIQMEKDRINNGKKIGQFHDKITKVVSDIVKICADNINEKEITTKVIVMSPLAEKNLFLYRVEYRGKSIYIISIYINNLRIINTGYAPGNDFLYYVTDNRRNHLYEIFANNIDREVNKLKGETIKTI